MKEALGLVDTGKLRFGRCLREVGAKAIDARQPTARQRSGALGKVFAESRDDIGHRLVVGGTGDNHRRLATCHSGLRPKRGDHRQHECGFARARWTIDCQHIARLPGHQMRQGITLGRGQCVFVTSVAQARGKKATSGQARLVRAWVTLGEALEQRGIGLMLTQVVVEVDDVLAEAVRFVFFEQQAVLGRLHAVFGRIPPLTDLTGHPQAERVKLTPLFKMLLNVDYFPLTRRCESGHLFDRQKVIQRRLCPDEESVLVQRLKNVTRH
ncbi:hypothetical protein D3C78_684710 [compost metagenome]